MYNQRSLEINLWLVYCKHYLLNLPKSVSVLQLNVDMRVVQKGCGLKKKLDF